MKSTQNCYASHEGNTKIPVKASIEEGRFPDLGKK